VRDEEGRGEGTGRGHPLVNNTGACEFLETPG